jgi:hypothetical protein
MRDIYKTVEFSTPDLANLAMALAPTDYYPPGSYFVD